SRSPAHGGAGQGDGVRFRPAPATSIVKLGSESNSSTRTRVIIAAAWARTGSSAPSVAADKLDLGRSRRYRGTGPPITSRYQRVSSFKDGCPALSLASKAIAAAG